MIVDDDALGHQRIAGAITAHLDRLDPGSVLALQGSWGRGKTNVLKRVFAVFADRATTSGAPAPLWLDPWRYGTPDLIKPIVLALLAAVPPQRWSRDEKLRLAAKTLLRAGNAMMFKAITLFTPAPVGEVVGEAEKPISDMLDAMFDGRRQDKDIDPDPVEAMATRFRELVDRYLDLSVGSGQLLVCVDDLDRCLPDHQIAMLEAIHFLTSADARCAFLIALDPVLVQQAAITHYRTPGFDSNKYLDKLFTLRLRLPELGSASVLKLLGSELTASTRQALREGLGVGPEQVATAFADVFSLPELRNPRLIHRVCERLRLLASSNIGDRDARLMGPERLVAVVTWCAIADRWPEVRQILQDSPLPMWSDNLRIVCFTYGFNDVFGDARPRAVIEEELRRFSNVPDRLPGRQRQPDLGEFLHGQVLGAPGFVASLAEVDAAMVTFGL